MAINLATAYVEIVPSLQGFHRPINQAFGDVQNQADRAGRQSGSRFSAGFGKVLKTGAVGVASAAGGLMATALVKGFSRLNSMDQAKSKMMALKMSTQEVESAMESANKSVKGTSFGLDEAAGAAAMASAAGVKLGTDMDKYLTVVADAAAVGGASMSEMGAIFGKVAGKGKLDGEVMAQLMDRQIGILPALAEKYGVTTEAASKMVSDGKVSFADFQDVMENMVGGGAAKMGKTFSGSMKNMQAALGRVGAKLLEPVFKAAPPVFDAIGTGLDNIGKMVEPAIGGMMTSLTSAFAGADGASLFDGLKSAGASALGFLKDLWTNLQGPIQSIGATIREDLLPVFTNIAEWVSTHGSSLKGIWDGLSPVLTTVAGLLAGAVATGFNIVAGVIGGVAKAVLAVAGYFVENKDAAIALAAVLGTVAAAFAPIAATALAFKFAALYVKGYALATKVAAGFTKAWAVAQRVLNLSLLSNPIFLVVAALVALGVGLVMAYRKSETFRNIVQAAWNGIKVAISAVWSWISGTLWPGIQSVFSTIGTVVMWLWTNVMQPAWTGIQLLISVWWTAVKMYFTAVINIIKTIASVVMWLWNNAFAPAFAAIGAVIAFAWNNVINPVINAIIAIFKVVASVVMWLWNNAIVPAWNGIQVAIEVAKGVISNVIDGVKAVFQSVADKAGVVRDFIVNAWQKVTDFFGSVKDKIAQTASGMWNGIKDSFKAMVNFLIRGWNSFAEKLSFTVPDIPGVPRRGDKIQPIPTIPELAVGGRAGAGKRGDGLLFGPGTGTSDSILGLDAMGVPTAMVSAGEFVVNAQATKQWLPLLAALNGGAGVGGLGIQALATGGLVSGADLLRFAGGENVGGKQHSRSLEGSPYTWGGGSRTDWGDCSGMLSMLAALLTGKNPFQRYFSTGSEGSWIQSNGGHLGKPGSLVDKFVTGWFNGGPYGGHTAGTIYDGSKGTNVEMGGNRGNGQIGGQAAAWNNAQFTDWGWFDLKPSKPMFDADTGRGNAGIKFDDNPDIGDVDTTTANPSTIPTGDTGAKSEKTSLSSIFGAAMEEQAKDVLDLFGIPDSPSMLTAYNELDDHRKKKDASPKVTGDGSGTGTLDAGEEARLKADFEDDQVKKKRALEDKLSQLDADYAKRVANTKDAAQKQQIRQELAEKKRALKRAAEDQARADKRKFEEDKRQRQAATKSGSNLGTAPSVDASPDAAKGDPVAPVVVDPNAQPKVAWKAGMGADPWRPMLEWGIGRVGKGLTTAKGQVDAGIKQIGSESGGDPNIAQQIVDVNGTGEAGGVGLLQIIPNTFKAFRDAALPDNRRDPAANIVAALRYYVDRYGPNLTAQWGQGHGYKTGGYTGNFGVNEVAGHVHGREFVINAAATSAWRPELEAINAGKSPELARGRAGAGGRGYSPVTNVTLRDEKAYYERDKRTKAIVAARMV